MDELNFNKEPNNVNLNKESHAEPDTSAPQISNSTFSEQKSDKDTQSAQNSDPYNQYVQPNQNAQQYGSNQYYQQTNNQQQGQGYPQPQQTYGQPQQNNGYIPPYGQPQNPQYNNQYGQQQNTYQQYPYPQNDYNQSPFGAASAVYPNSSKTGMAVASLVLGICSIVFGIFMFVFPPLAIAPIIGLILGIVFKCKHLSVGKGISTAGIITSSIGIFLPIIFIIIILLNMSSMMNFVEEYSPEDYNQMYDEYYDDFPEWFDGAQIQDIIN